MPRIIERPIAYDQAGIDKNLAKRARKLAEMKVFPPLRSHLLPAAALPNASLQGSLTSAR